MLLAPSGPGELRVAAQPLNRLGTEYGAVSPQRRHSSPGSAVGSVGAPGAGEPAARPDSPSRPKPVAPTSPGSPRLQSSPHPRALAAPPTPWPTARKGLAREASNHPEGWWDRRGALHLLAFPPS